MKFSPKEKFLFCSMPLLNALKYRWRLTTGKQVQHPCYEFGSILNEILIPKTKTKFWEWAFIHWKCRGSARSSQKTHPQAAFGIHDHCSDRSANVSNGYKIWCIFHEYIRMHFHYSFVSHLLPAHANQVRTIVTTNVKSSIVFFV